jgi:hypothetical protein
MFPPSSNSAARVAGAAARVSAACGCSTGPATRTLSTAETVSVMHDREARLPDSTSTAHLYAYDRCCKHLRPYGSDRTSGRPSPPAYLSTKNPPRSCAQLTAAQLYHMFGIDPRSGRARGLPRLALFLVTDWAVGIIHMAGPLRLLSMNDSVQSTTLLPPARSWG